MVHAPPSEYVLILASKWRDVNIAVALSKANSLVLCIVYSTFSLTEIKTTSSGSLVGLVVSKWHAYYLLEGAG